MTPTHRWLIFVLVVWFLGWIQNSGLRDKVPGEDAPRITVTWKPDSTTQPTREEVELVAGILDELARLNEQKPSAPNGT